MAPHSRLLRSVLAALAILAGLGLLAVLLIDTSAIAERVKDRVLPAVADRLGRPVTAGPVEASVFPVPTARISDLVVGARSPADPPLLATGEARVRLALWPLIRSLGKEVRASSVELLNPEVNVARLADGTWSFQDILDRLATTEGEPALPEAPAEERRIVVDRFSLVEGVVHVADLSVPGRRTTDITGIEVTATGVGPGERLELQVAAAVGGSGENVKLDVSIEPMPAGPIATLPPGSWPEVTGSAEVKAVPFTGLEGFVPVGVAAVITGGQVNFDARIETRNDGIYVIVANGALEHLALRGKPASGRFRATVLVPPGNTRETTLQVENVRVEGPGVDFTATALIAGLPPARATFAVQGDRLDLDALLGALPPEALAPRVPGGGLLSPDAQRQLQGLAFDGSLAFAEVVRGNLTARDVRAEATLRGGVLTLVRGGAALYGGSIEMGGTTVDFTGPEPAWKLVARLDEVDLARAMTEIAGEAPLAGRLGGNLDVAGRGTEWTEVRTNATGSGALRLQGGVLRTADLGAALTTRLVEGLSRQGLGSVLPPGGGEATRLRDLLLSFSVVNGWLRLDRPITIESSFGTATLDGAVGLDQRLDLDGTARLSPDVVARASGGKLRPDGPVTVPIQISGSLGAPRVGAIDTDALVRSVLPGVRVEAEVHRRKEQVRERIRREAEKRVGEARDRLGGGG